MSLKELIDDSTHDSADDGRCGFDINSRLLLLMLSVLCHVYQWLYFGPTYINTHIHVYSKQTYMPRYKAQPTFQISS